MISIAAWLRESFPTGLMKYSKGYSAYAMKNQIDPITRNQLIVPRKNPNSESEIFSLRMAAANLEMFGV